ncbi:MAG: hypothetical protein HC914_10870 [Chloroflexaceae bacterium]|nr:hypothetical protein [Chloroflexaceae bacterium]
MPKYIASTSQFRLVSGMQQSTSDLILLTEPRSPLSPEARKGRLYILVEADQDIARGKDACQLAVRTVSKAFYTNDSYSVTSSLRGALAEANRALYQHNFKVPSHKRASVGITCAVLKEHDLYLAQVAPTQAYILQQGKVRALPTPTGWDAAHLSTAPFVQHQPLGHSLYIDPELYRCQLQPHESVLICSSNLAPLLSAADVERILRLSNSAAIMTHLDTFCMQHGLTEAHALSMQLVPATRAEPANPPRTVPKEARARGFAGLGKLVGGRAAQETPAQPRRVTQPPSEYVPPRAPEVPPINLGEGLEEQYSRASNRPLPPSSFLGEDTPLPRLPAPAIDLSDPYLKQAATTHPYRPRHQRRPVAAMGIGERLLYPFAWAGAGVQDFLGGLRPRAGRSRRSAASGAGKLRFVSSANQPEEPRRGVAQSLLVFMLLSGLVVMLILYGLTISQRATDDRTLGYLDAAEERMLLVQQSASQEEATERLEQAARAIEELRNSPQITDTNPSFWLRFQELQTSYEEAEAAIHLVSYIDELNVIAQHPQPGRNFTRLVVPPPTSNFTDTAAINAVQYVYALDGSRETAQMYRIPREGGTPEPHLTPGATVQSTIVGPLQAAAWRLDNVVTIDQGANGFGYFFQAGGNWNHIRLGGSEVWTPGGRIDLETYEGNLYVWGAEQNEILKFSSGRYGDIPQLWLDPAGLDGRDLNTSVDMAIDGQIYLLQPDGRVYVLSQGAFVREIVPEQITPPISIVTRFVVTGAADTGFIFLLDALHERVIQIDKQTGAVIQQMKMRTGSSIRLNSLLDFGIEMGGNRPILYLINGDQIMKTPLPVPPEPFSTAGAASTEE